MVYKEVSENSHLFPVIYFLYFLISVLSELNWIYFS